MKKRSFLHAILCAILLFGTIAPCIAADQDQSVSSSSQFQRFQRWIGARTKAQVADVQLLWRWGSKKTCGQEVSKKELAAAKRVAKKVGISLAVIGGMIGTLLYRAPLSYAVEVGNKQIFDDLLEEEGIDMSERQGRFNNTALNEAAMAGRLDMVNSLLNKGADVNKSGRRGYTPLLLAAKYNHADIVKRLIQAPGIDINAYVPRGVYGPTVDWGALDFAVWNENNMMLNELLKTTIDLKGGGRLLLLALLKNNFGALDLLLKTSKIDAEKKEWALRSSGRPDFISRLLQEQDIDINAQDSSGMTALDLAANNKDKLKVRLLLMRGATPSNNPLVQQVLREIGQEARSREIGERKRPTRRRRRRVALVGAGRE